MPRGSLPGEWRGGRQKGTKNKATIERELLAQRMPAVLAEYIKRGPHRPPLKCNYWRLPPAMFWIASSGKTRRESFQSPAHLKSKVVTGCCADFALSVAISTLKVRGPPEKNAYFYLLQLQTISLFVINRG
jgi:hypothetical protein